MFIKTSACKSALTAVLGGEDAAWQDDKVRAG
jgi:hypothetical protein